VTTDIDTILSGDSSIVGALTYNITAHLVGSSSIAGVQLHNISAHLAGTSTFVPVATLELGGYEAPIRYQPPARVVSAGRMILDDVDLFLGDGRTRVREVPVTDLQLQLIFNNEQISWPLVSGAGIPDVRVTAGSVYWTEFAPGFYNVRFFPNVIGLWRIILTYRSYDQAVSLSYDVIQKVSLNPSTGLSTSFFKR
jgi:hypothetical protein